MKKVIPERTETTCDLCQDIDIGLNFKSKGQILVTGVNINSAGHPISPVRKQYDLCDDCYGEIINYINVRLPHGIK